ncbi:MAG: MFS transporter [Alphaproteobacteria bacterium]
MSAPPAAAGGIPHAALYGTLAVQTLCTMAAYSISVAAPEIAAELGIPGSTVGYYISMVYGFGMISAIASPGFIHRFGPIRINQYCLLTAMASLLVAAFGGTVALIAFSAFVIGTGYGATAPASSYILARRTPPQVVNLVFAIRQTGVPLGGVLAGVAVPPLLLAFGWQGALLIELLPMALLLVLLQLLRREYDRDREPGRALFPGGPLRPLRLIVDVPALRLLSVVSFVYSGTQLCFGAFMVVYLTERVGFPLVAAGLGLAVYQVAAFAARIVLGWVADRWVAPRILLGAQGVIMAVMAVVAGLFGAGWPLWAILGVCAVAGATASGFTGLAYAEYARIGGAARAAEVTSVGAFMMFLGVMVMPSLFSLIVGVTGSYAAAFDAVAVVALLSGIALLLSRPRAASPPAPGT